MGADKEGPAESTARRRANRAGNYLICPIATFADSLIANLTRSLGRS